MISLDLESRLMLSYQEKKKSLFPLIFERKFREKYTPVLIPYCLLILYLEITITVAMGS